MVRINLVGCSTSGRCSSVAGVEGYCHHVVGLLYYMAPCKQRGLRSVPDALTCTSMPQRWCIPREKRIEPKETQDILVKKPKVGANYNKFIKSTLYSPSDVYCTMTKENFDNFKIKSLLASSLPRAEKLASIPLENSKYGKVLRGSILSNQQNSLKIMLLMILVVLISLNYLWTLLKPDLTTVFQLP